MGTVHDSPQAALRLPNVQSMTRLTKREREVLAMIGRCCTDQEIASALRIARDTVRNHIKAVRKKLRPKCRAHMALIAVQHGLAPPPG